MLLRSVRLSVAAAILSNPAYAHTGIGGTSGLGHGFLHPLGGADHLLAMVTVGLLAAQLGGCAFWLLPIAFLTMMAVGAALGIAGVALPAVEIGIGLSVVVFGLAVALRWRIPVALATAAVGAFAVFHGHAHGAEMPDDVSRASYAVGFVIATGLLHAAGLGLGSWAGRMGGAAPRTTRIAGAGVALAGLVLLAKLG